MDESRAALVKMIRSVDPVVDFVRRNPDCLGDDRLEDRFREVVEWFHQRVSREDFGHEDQQHVELRHHDKPDRRETETPTAAGGQRRNSRQTRRDPTRIRQMVQRRRRRRPPGTPRGFTDAREGSRMATRRVPCPCRTVGENISGNSWTTSAITATPGCRVPTPPPTGAGSARGSSTNATASRGACSIPIAQCGSRSCRAGPGAHEPTGPT